MKSKPRHPPLTPSTWRTRLGWAAFVLALCGMPVLAFFAWSNPWILMFLTFFYIVTAMVLQSRVISCVLAGIFLGMLFDSGVQSGGHESRVWEMVRNLFFGLFVGAALGFLWDYGDLQEEEPARPRPKPRR